ncbi:MAG: 50S ribosomal protein L9 [Verrucomicrobiota bacterium]|nr:50S ribosomal protein L9 [Verrucomicrobiota bacterium]
MSTTEILLVEPIENLGSEGDIVKVRPGYARNFLFPRKKALPLNQANKKRLDALKVARAAREADEIQGAQEIGSKLNDVSIAVAVKTGSGGKLFGSVTAQQILEKLDEKGFKLDKKHLVRFVPVKELGQTEVTCQLHKDVTAKFKVEVVSENPIEEVAE